MCSFLSLKQARSRQGGRAYDVDVTKAERKIRAEPGRECMTNADAQRRKQNKTPVTNFI